jgi:alkylation response protein AidB-like acyl-CoA dehydrogenase
LTSHLQYIHFTKHPLCKNGDSRPAALSETTMRQAVASHYARVRPTAQAPPPSPRKLFMIERTLFTPDHEAFRDAFRKFCEKEVAPHHDAWEEQGYVDRAVWDKAGANGYLCASMPEEYGGVGADKLYSAIQMEELARGGWSGIGFGLHSEIVAPYILHYGTEDQKKKYLPKLASGEMVGAIAMSEPAAGSDLQGIKSTAIRQADGSFVLNGSKTFITNGWHADLVIVVAKTNPEAGAKGTSLLLVERGMPGFEKGKRLKKLGLKAQDTSELFFDNVKLPADAVLGGEAQLNRGFIGLMEQLPWERLQIAITAVASAQAAIDWTVQYVKDRKVFGQPVAAFQNTRYKLAEMQTEVQVARVFVDKCLELVAKDKLDTATASMAKYWTSDLQCKVMDECVQLHGGYGFMWEYPITRAYADARVQRIYGGTNEIMKEVITRSMGLGR